MLHDKMAYVGNTITGGKDSTTPKESTIDAAMHSLEKLADGIEGSIDRLEALHSRLYGHSPDDANDTEASPSPPACAVDRISRAVSRIAALDDRLRANVSRIEYIA